MNILQNILGSTPPPDHSKILDHPKMKGISAEERKFMNDMPEKIDFEGLGDLDALEDDFCKGLEDIENQFHKLVQKAEYNFDKKHS